MERNIFFSKNRALIADFDQFTKCEEEPVLSSTEFYIPPEAYAGRILDGVWSSNCANDAFALGTIVHILLTGFAPPSALASVYDQKDIQNQAWSQLEKGFEPVTSLSEGWEGAGSDDLAWLKKFVRFGLRRDIKERGKLYDAEVNLLERGREGQTRL